MQVTRPITPVRAAAVSSGNAKRSQRGLLSATPERARRHQRRRRTGTLMRAEGRRVARTPEALAPEWSTGTDLFPLEGAVRGGRRRRRHGTLRTDHSGRTLMGRPHPRGLGARSGPPARIYFPLEGAVRGGERPAAIMAPCGRTTQGEPQSGRPHPRGLGARSGPRHGSTRPKARRRGGSRAHHPYFS